MRVLAAAIALCAALAQPLWAQDPVLPYGVDDPRMNTAILAAQKTLPLFLAAALDAQGMSRPGFIIKVAMPKASDATAHEHIWVTPFGRLSDGSFSGYLNNEPDDLGDLAFGDRVRFSQSMISDWTVMSADGLAYGQYTTRVMFEDGVFGEERFEQIFEDDPVPADWP